MYYLLLDGVGFNVCSFLWIYKLLVGFSYLSLLIPCLFFSIAMVITFYAYSLDLRESDVVEIKRQQ